MSNEPRPHGHASFEDAERCMHGEHPGPNVQRSIAADLARDQIAAIRIAAERLDATESADDVDAIVSASIGPASSPGEPRQARDGTHLACERLGRYLADIGRGLSDHELLNAVEAVGSAFSPAELTRRELDKAYRAGQSAARTEAALNPQLIGPVVVRPGDRLLINAGPRATNQTAGELMRQVRRYWPDLEHRVLILAAEDVAVIEASDQAGG